MDIERVNTYAATWTIAGWVAGLAYFNWFATAPLHVPWWGHVLLVIAGAFGASMIIGGGMALVAALLTKWLTGQSDGSIDVYAWAAFISPVLAFFAVPLAFELIL